jgi:hypothetical protein
MSSAPCALFNASDAPLEGATPLKRTSIVEILLTQS